MSRSPIALVVLFFAALLVPAAPAQAAYSVLCTGYTSCADKGYSHGGYASNKHKSYWNMYTGTNCTNYVAYRLVTTNGLPNKRPKSGVGNARDWGKAMASVTDKVPTKGSVAWWGKTGNHVAYVEKVVSSTEIWVSESNWSGAFDWRKITKSGSGWPDGFIHFSDPKFTNTAKPTISPPPKVGRQVKATAGTWTPAGSSYAYQWMADGAAIRGATANTFVPAAAQVDKKLTVQVTASRAGYPAAKVTSAASQVQLGTLSRSQDPSVSGQPQVGATLVASPGTVTPATAFGYQWFADDVEVPGAQRTTFSPTGEHAGKQISVRVRAGAVGYKTSARIVRVDDPVAAGQLQAGSAPRIVGPATVGSRLTANPGVWSGSGLTFGYEWRAAGIAIPGATAASYTVTPADRGKSITVKVTARGPGYVPASNLSAPTPAVQPGTFTAGVKPAVSGSLRVGGQLSVTTGGWTPGAEMHHLQWYAGQTAIPGATGTSYRLTHRERGQQIWVRVQATRAGFTSAVAYTTRTSPVAAGLITHAKQPAIVGAALHGTTLKVDPGAFSPTNAAVRYQWLRDGTKLSGATGASRKVSKNDIGHRLTVSATYQATGYSGRTVVTAPTAKIKTTAKISTHASRPGPGQATFSVKISATGVTAAKGTLTVHRGSRLVGQATVRAGKATIKLSKQPAGRQTYRFTFGATSTTVRSAHDHSLTIG